VSEITRFYCQLDMTSSSVLRQGALHALLHKGFLKSDYVCLIVIHCRVLSAMQVSEITRFYSQPDITPSSVLRQEALHAPFHDGFWTSDLDFLIAFHSNFLYGMHGFRDNEVLFQVGYDAIVIYSPGWRCTQCFDCRFWKDDPNFILVLHWNYTSIVHRFRFNDLFMLAGNDVIPISSLGGASDNFWLRILKGRSWIYICVQMRLIVYFERFRR